MATVQHTGAMFMNEGNARNVILCLGCRGSGNKKREEGTIREVPPEPQPAAAGDLLGLPEVLLLNFSALR